MIYLVIFVGIAILIYAYFDNIPRPTETDFIGDLASIVIVTIAVFFIIGFLSLLFRPPL